MTIAAPSVAKLRHNLRLSKAALINSFLAAPPAPGAAQRLTRSLSKLVDQYLRGLWAQCKLGQRATLVAVGGYGRGELFPYSDIDVLVLRKPQKADDEMQCELIPYIERFITACWDTGLEISSSVRTVPQCLEESCRDITVQTAILESRLICGSHAQFKTLVHAQTQSVDVKAYFRAKTLEMRQRHQKHDDTPYALEPNCKESPGGLRDLQVVMWVARAAGFGKTWSELAIKGLLTTYEARQLQRNEGLLKLIRARLHAVAGRREDRLLFDLQTSVASTFGLLATPGQRASEKLMRRYYWAAKAVTQLNQILMLNIEERINSLVDAPMRRINPQFFDRGGLLEVASDDTYHQDPQAILVTFWLYQTQPGINGLSARTLRALYNARHLMNKEFRSNAVNRETFMKILQAPRGQTHALRMMNATSVLGRTLWVFRRIVGQMQHDLFHVYTVDQHILRVVRNIRRFFVPEHSHEYPCCSEIAAQWDRPYILLVAALFHDIAKGRGGDHSALGAHEVKRFCHQYNIPASDSELIEFLVAHHLSLSHTAQKSDLSDPTVIHRFLQIVRTERRLNALYLLTVADIRGTSPKVWSAWKAQLLKDLYQLTLKALGGGQPNHSADIEARKLEARQELSLLSYPLLVEQPLWNTLHISYFARHDSNSIAWHVRSIAGQIQSPQPVVNARLSPLAEGLQVLVYSRDRADLFARICGYFDFAGFDILYAKVHTTKAGYALDTFQVISRQEEKHYRDLISLVQTQLGQSIHSNEALPEAYPTRISRRMRSFPIYPRITLQPEECGQRWILTVTASDRPGLLYGIARVLARHKINLHLAKITTLGERVEDTFLIDGPTLQNNKLQLQIENELLETLSM